MTDFPLFGVYVIVHNKYAVWKMDEFAKSCMYIFTFLCIFWLENMFCDDSYRQKKKIELIISKLFFVIKSIF